MKSIQDYGPEQRLLVRVKSLSIVGSTQVVEQSGDYVCLGGDGCWDTSFGWTLASDIQVLAELKPYQRPQPKLPV